MNKIKAGIMGGSGYTGGEMLRLLINHPEVEIAFVNSRSNAQNLVSDVHTDLVGDTDLRFSNKIMPDIDILFLCVGHGDAKKFLQANPMDEKVKIIDLSQDFRLNQSSKWQNRDFVYGLPELNKQTIRLASNIANPGCFATGIQLGLLPLAKAGLLNSQVHINATTGSTGAGQSLSSTSHFSWRNNNLSAYKAFNHQHLYEITERLQQFGFKNDQLEINLVPQRGNFTRGILASMYVNCDLSQDHAYSLYQNYYADAPFTHLSRHNIDLKQVVNTNKCLIHLEKHGNKLFIVSIIDNLLKGACGQAVQNMNLMFKLDEKTGLRLKAAGF